MRGRGKLYIKKKMSKQQQEERQSELGKTDPGD